MEIKEILDRLDYNEWEVDLYKVPITWCELYDIRDYITNLQKTNKNHSKKLIELGDKLTNLQQENQELNKENEKWWAIIKDNEQEIKDLCLENSKLEQENERLEEAQKNFEKQFIKEMDYKSRCEKAVEYIKKHIEKCNIDGYEGKFDNFDIFTKPQNLLNILEGKDNE